jgi:kynurenine formamidase
VANLDRVPATGATVVVAPAKLEGGSGGRSGFSLL